jgi:hypothetical protein
VAPPIGRNGPAPRSSSKGMTLEPRRYAGWPSIRQLTGVSGR